MNAKILDFISLKENSHLMPSNQFQPQNFNDRNKSFEKACKIYEVAIKNSLKKRILMKFELLFTDA
jgi:hypothetical protein